VIVVYRLASSRFPANSGAGAALHGGRWNPVGTEVIYTADSQPLAALEILAHYEVLPKDFVITPIQLRRLTWLRESERSGLRAMHPRYSGFPRLSFQRRGIMFWTWRTRTSGASSFRLPSRSNSILGLS